MPHTDEQLRIGSTYFRYHIKMYVETLLWLQDYPITPDTWDTHRNAILEDHLVHARVLINFICNTKARPTDVIGIHYFHDHPGIFSAIKDDFLEDQAENIGGRLVHLTTKPMPELKSEQEWLLRDTAIRLSTGVKTFLSIVPEQRLAEGVKVECSRQLARLFPPNVPVSIHAST